MASSRSAPVPPKRSIPLVEWEKKLAAVRVRKEDLASSQL